MIVSMVLLTPECRLLGIKTLPLLCWQFKVLQAAASGGLKTLPLLCWQFKVLQAAASGGCHDGKALTAVFKSVQIKV